MAKTDLKKTILALLNDIKANEFQKSGPEGREAAVKKIRDQIIEVRALIKTRITLSKEIRATGKKPEGQDAIQDRIYEITFKLDERVRWLENHTSRLLEELKKKKGFGGLGGHRNMGNAEAILKKCKTLKADNKAAKNDKGTTPAKTLENLETYEKVFDKTFISLKKKLNALWNRAKPSDIARSLPVDRYDAVLPDDIDTSKLTIAGDLGSGGFGAISKLIHDGPKKEAFAFKKLTDQFKSEKEKSLELQKEVLLYEKIGHHPNIAKCYGIMKVNGEEGMAMEMLEGGSVSQNFDKLNALYKTGNISDTEYMGFVQHTMTGLMQGLAHMEKAGVAHLDIKFPNVMLDAEGQVKIIDPGISEETGLHADIIPDNPMYTDPLLKTNKIAQPTNDIFSSGLALYEANMAFKQKDREGPGGERFIFGAQSTKFASVVEKTGKEWIKDFSNRVLKVMSPSDKVELEKLLTDERDALNEKLDTMKEVVASLEKSKGKDSQDAIEARKFAREEAEAAIIESQERVNTIRKDFFNKYGSPYESAYIKFLNKLMHPNPAKRLTAEKALDHPFLSDRLVGDDDQIKDVFYKVNPGLKDKTPEDPGTPVKIEAPEPEELDIPAKKRQELKKKAEGLSEPGKMEAVANKELKKLFDRMKKYYVKWEKNSRPHKSEITINHILGLAGRIPTGDQVLGDMSRGRMGIVKGVIRDLGEFLGVSKKGIIYFTNKKSLKEGESAVKHILEDFESKTIAFIEKLNEYLIFEGAWRHAFGTSADGKTLSYDRMETQKKNLTDRTEDAYQKLKAEFAKEDPKSAGKKAKSAVIEETLHEKGLLETQLDTWMRKARKFVKEPQINALFDLGNKKTTWKRFSSHAMQKDRLWVLLETTQSQLETLPAKGGSTTERRIKSLLEELADLVENTIIPAFEEVLVRNVYMGKR